MSPLERTRAPAALGMARTRVVRSAPGGRVSGCASRQGRPLPSGFTRSSQCPRRADLSSCAGSHLPVPPIGPGAQELVHREGKCSGDAGGRRWAPLGAPPGPAPAPLPARGVCSRLRVTLLQDTCGLREPRPLWSAPSSRAGPRPLTTLRTREGPRSLPRQRPAPTAPDTAGERRDSPCRGPHIPPSVRRAHTRNTWSARSRGLRWAKRRK